MVIVICCVALCDSKRRTDSDMSDGDAESETEKSDAEIGETACDDGPVMRQNHDISLETDRLILECPEDEQNFKIQDVL